MTDKPPDKTTKSAPPKSMSKEGSWLPRISQALGVAEFVGTVASAFKGMPAPPVLTDDQMKRLRGRASGIAASDDVLAEASRALMLAQSIRSRQYKVDDAYNRLEFIFECLSKKPVQIVMAQEARLDLQFEVYRQSGFFTRWLARLTDGNTTALVVTALVTSFSLWFLFGLVLSWWSNASLLQAAGLSPGIFFMDGRALWAVASAAIAGGILSIVTRMGEFTRVRDMDPLAMFLTATFKPLIGVVLSVFILAALAGDIVSFGFLGVDPLHLAATPASADPPKKVLYVLWAVGFLAGFSERFAWDFVDRATGATLGGLRTTNPPPAAVAAPPTGSPPPPGTPRPARASRPRSKSTSPPP